MWQDVRLGLRRFTIIAAGVLIATLWFAGDAKVFAGTASDDSVLLDPFDPVPQIGFHHGDCDDPCGYHRCHEGCYRHRARCERDCCGRACDEEYWAYFWSLRRYEHETDTYNVLLDIYMDELRTYDRRYLGHFDEHAFEEWRRQFHDHVPHYGTADHRDGEHDGDWHDGDHHDGDHHDGDHYDGDHGDGHDGDHHDGNSHDGDHHDGDHHDGDWHDGDHHDGDHDGDDQHHDGQWQDRDGNWHDGPPPDGYGH
ncbi:MAG TPA: hypothetical protein VN932_09945 [Rhizomicrobium sp.]|nr:hypothetical protein [Rhizomicrobium sp.]